MKKIFLAFGLIATFATQGAWAQNQADATTTVKAPETTTTYFLNHAIAEFRQDTNVNQAYKLQDRSQQYVSYQQEARLGWKLGNDWQLVGIGAQVATTYGGNAPNTTTWTSADPSISLGHPIYKSPEFVMTGEARRYFRGFASTIKNQTDQYQYYLRASYTPTARWEIFNLVSPHYYAQPQFADADTTYYLEGKTVASYRMSKWWTLGVGQYTQLEYHSRTETGLNVEVFPAVEIDLAPNLMIWPAIFVPVAAQAAVGGGATSASVDNTRAELYIMATL